MDVVGVVRLVSMDVVSCECGEVGEFECCECGEVGELWML